MNTLESYLRHHAATQPDAVAIILPVASPSAPEEAFSALTYSALWQQVEERTSELRQQGVKARQVVCVRTEQNADFLVTYFALHTLGAVAMPLEHDLPDDRFSDIARRYEAFTPPPQVADILFTTGTTGQPKGVMLSHDAIMADAENLIGAMGFEPPLVFIICGPLNHIGSLSKVWPVIRQGASLCILPGLKDLNLFFKAMDDESSKNLRNLCNQCDKVQSSKFKVQSTSSKVQSSKFKVQSTSYATFLVPASVRMLLQLAPRQLAECADRLSFIESGAAALPHADMQKLCRLLPHTRLYNTYASTETGIICTYNYNDGRCLPQCLGRPMLHARVAINDEGHIVCSGRTLMTGYAEAAIELSEEAAKEPERIVTADLGHIDAEGMLHLTGRTGDVINVGGFKVAPTEVESAAMAHPDVADCVCTAVASPVTGQALRLLVVLREGCTLNRRALALFLSQRLERHKVPLLYQQVEHIERTFNGKINRKYYYRG